MRSKEDAHDYRYFPEPDLVPLVVDKAKIDSLRKSLPELPQEKRRRFISTFSITPYMAQILTESRDVAQYFEDTIRFCANAKLSANWIMGEVLRLQKEKNIPVVSLKVTPKRLGSLLNMVADNSISANAAKKVFDFVEEQDKEPEAIVNELGLKQISDTSVLETTAMEIINKFQAEVARYKAGDLKLMGFFVGQAMKATKGKGNPGEINRLMSKILGE
jgi:aspartyl-tRNA(Asn)/glutamyl-tRNA(Gln) amidotransferase subunit B